MKKIMFNDKYMLTNLVLKGRKTMTRRIVELPKGVNPDEIKTVFENSKEGYFQLFKSFFPDSDYFKIKPTYNIGEEVAIAQSYESLNNMGFVAPEWCEHSCEDSAGYTNKMFVRADLMPHRIKITGMNLERLQDIRDESCVKEGIGRIVVETSHGMKIKYIHGGTLKAIQIMDFDTPQKAFAHLIDGIAGRGTWYKNPWVIAYEFELL